MLKQVGDPLSLSTVGVGQDLKARWSALAVMVCSCLCSGKGISAEWEGGGYDPHRSVEMPMKRSEFSRSIFENWPYLRYRFEPLLDRNARFNKVYD